MPGEDKWHESRKSMRKSGGEGLSLWQPNAHTCDDTGCCSSRCSGSRAFGGGSGSGSARARTGWKKEGGRDGKGTQHTGREEVHGKDVLRLVGRRSSGDDDRDPDPPALPCSSPPAPPLRLHLPRPASQSAPGRTLLCSSSSEDQSSGGEREKKRKSPEECIHAELLSAWSGAPSRSPLALLSPLCIHFCSTSLTFFSCDSGGDFARVRQQQQDERREEEEWYAPTCRTLFTALFS